MKTIGLIGGISWQSTLEYYRIINTAVTKQTQGKHAAKIVIDSLDIGEVDDFVSRQDFKGLTELVVGSAQKLEKAGAGLLMIGANTIHFIADQVENAISIPLIHITDVTISKIKEKGLKRIGLFGTKFTMEQDFYKSRIRNAGIDVLIPGEKERKLIQEVIVTELFKAYINPESKTKFLQIIDSLADKGAEGIILGCTEIPLLIHQSDCTIPVFDTTEIHALAAVEAAL